MLEDTSFVTAILETLSSSVNEICEYANIELEMGTMSKEDYNDFRNELEKVLSKYPNLRDE